MPGLPDGIKKQKQELLELQLLSCDPVFIETGSVFDGNPIAVMCDNPVSIITLALLDAQPTQVRQQIDGDGHKHKYRDDSAET